MALGDNEYRRWLRLLDGRLLRLASGRTHLGHEQKLAGGECDVYLDPGWFHGATQSAVGALGQSVRAAIWRYAEG